MQVEVVNVSQLAKKHYNLHKDRMDLICIIPYRVLGEKHISTIGLCVPKLKDLSKTEYIDKLDINDYGICDLWDIRNVVERVTDTNFKWTTDNREEFDCAIFNSKYKVFKDRIKSILVEMCYNNSDTVQSSWESLVNVIMTYAMKSELGINNERQIQLEHYDNVYFISDLHFGHKNIIAYENRAEKLGIKPNEDKNVEMELCEEEIINRWNNVVKKNDLVFILGDFSFYNIDKTMEILRELKGNKVLIKGNHDGFVDKMAFDRSLFLGVYDYKEVKYKDRELVLMHYPIQSFRNANRQKQGKSTVHLFGHIHNTQCAIPKLSYNVSAVMNNYTPVHIDYIIPKAEENIEGKMNIE